MYEIRPESIKTFITAGNIRLPRFQRKQTWDAKRNFELCISVFKNYPIGVSILSVDENKNKSVRWLLDGRQRRNALKLMYEDPENVYYWAQKFIKFRNNDNPHQIQEQFWKKINEFLEAEVEDAQELEDSLENNVDIEQEELPDEIELQEGTVENSDLKGLYLLYEIIRLCHNKSKKGTGFTLPFDFSKYDVKMPYVVVQDGQQILSSRRLKTFLNNYVTYCNDDNNDYREEANFKHFIEDQFAVDITSALDAYIHRNWKLFVERIDLLLRIDDLFSTQTIGLIEVKNLQPSDSQKIFNLINSQGSPLKAVEILSARPKWNLKIESPCGEVKQLVQDLYRTQMDIVPEGVVRWDMAATFLRRLPEDNFIFKKFTFSTSDFEKELTMAFKCLSGIFLKGVTKIDIDELANHPINWETDIDAMVVDINNMIKVMESFSYFRFFKSWKVSIQDMMSDAIALDYFILSYNEWKKQNRPMGSNTATKNFQKYCFTLLDRLVYEYVCSQWKGSGDARVHNDIVNADSARKITTEKWLELLEGIYDTNRINDRSVAYGYMQSILYHFYALNELAAPSTITSYDIDHIIPQSIIKNSSLDRRDEIADNLFNLALLPKSENISKGNKKLSLIDDAWLKKQIKEYEFIEEKDYALFSDVSNYKQLYAHRKKFFIEAFNAKRTHLLNN